MSDETNGRLLALEVVLTELMARMPQGTFDAVIKAAAPQLMRQTAPGVTTLLQTLGTRRPRT